MKDLEKTLEDQKWKQFNELADRREAIREQLMNEIRKEGKCNYDICDKLLKQYDIELTKMDEWLEKYNKK